jgi:hypothetical protein
MHKADPQIVETLKWGVPHFDHNGIVAGMAAFKQHAAYGSGASAWCRKGSGRTQTGCFQKMRNAAWAAGK